MTTTSAAARAHPNIALVKYWGKRDTRLNLPAAGSVSITLDTLETVTEVCFDPNLDRDELILNDRVDTARLTRASQCLDRLRELASDNRRARIESRNNFPTAAGLASSASGFAALVTAAAKALGLDLPDRERSIHARQGSGSAARSIFGGFVHMHAGQQENGEDSFAEQLMTSSDWPLKVVVAVTNRSVKKHASTEGMEHTRRTSPFYRNWIESTATDVDQACRIIGQQDFQALADLAEHSCLKMHAVMMASQPGLMYFNSATMAGLHRVRELRASGVAAFFSVDAGPQIKVVCLPDHVGPVVDALEDLAGIQDVMETHCPG
jgi:diphosphomevalonate decarboxylase